MKRNTQLGLRHTYMVKSGTKGPSAANIKYTYKGTVFLKKNLHFDCDE